MNEKAGTRGGAGMNGAGMDDGTPMGAAEAVVIIQEAGQRARQQLRVSHRATFTIWGLGLLLGYGTMWLAVRGSSHSTGRRPRRLRRWR
jgi:hypothetical protein